MMLATTPLAGPKRDEAAIDKEVERAFAQYRDAGTLPQFTWKLKNVIEDIDMPGMQESNGIPVRLHAVRVKGDLVDTVEDVAEGFVRAGLWMEPVLKQPQLSAETQVTALDWSRFISYTALIQPDKRTGTCMVILGEANIGLGAAMKQMHQAPDFAPVPPPAKNLMRSRAETLQTLTFTVSGMAEADVKKFYSVEMKKLGYSEKDGTFEKGNEQIRLAVRKDNAEVVVMLVRHNTLAAPAGP
jgi:hypothetical protein